MSYDAPMRPLVYPLKNPLVIEAITEGDGDDCSPSLFSWPEDSDERVLVPFLLSLNEYNVIANAVEVGRDIAYGDDSIKVLWLWLRNMRCNVSICAMIIDCLLNDTDTQEALADLIANNPIVQQSLQQIIDNGTLIIGNPTIGQNDDLDKLFGICTYVTDTAFEAISDFYHIYEESTNQRELGEIIFEAIPVVETLPVDEISEYISALEEDVVESFFSQWTTTPITGSRDRIRCALFCAARENGNELTLEIIENYFWNRVGFTVSNITNVMGEFALFLVTGSWEGQEIVDISFGNFMAAMRQGQKFGTLIFPKFSTLSKLGANNPDGDWMTVCEDCPDQPFDEWDFTTGNQHSWEPVIAFGNDYADFDNGWIVDDDAAQIAIKRPDAGQAYDLVELYFDDPVSGIVASSIGDFDATDFITMTSDDNEFWATEDTPNIFNEGFFVDFVSSGSLSGRKIIKIRARRV